MSIHYRRTGGESYLNAFPHLRYWVVECVVCHRRGHRPELPERLGATIAAQTIRQLFHPLSLDADGLCEDCVAVREKFGGLPPQLPVA